MTPSNVVDLGSVEAVVRVNPDSQTGQAIAPPPRARPPRKGRAQKKAFQVDHRRVAEALSLARGYAVDPAKVALKVLETDCQAHYDEAHETVEWEVWDKQSPINGVPAREILGRPEYARADQIYLVRINGRVVFFQPHAPFLEGIVNLTDGDVEGYAIHHAGRLVEDIAFDRLISELNDDPELVAMPASMQAAIDPEAIAQAVAARVGVVRERPERRTPPGRMA